MPRLLMLDADVAASCAHAPLSQAATRFFYRCLILTLVSKL